MTRQTAEVIESAMLHYYRYWHDWKFENRYSATIARDAGRQMERIEEARKQMWDEVYTAEAVEILKTHLCDSNCNH